MLQSERLWILLLAGTAFLAGLAAGIAWGRGLAPTVETPPFAAFEARFARTFGLDAARRRDLRYYLAEYHADIEELEARQAAAAGDELDRLGDNCLKRIKTFVLRPDERERFDAMLAGTPGAFAPSATETP